MTKAIIVLATFIILLAACNGNGSSVDNTASSDTLTQPQPYPAYVAYLFKALNQHQDSVGLRFKLATALDSIGDYKNALIQIDSLIAKDTANYGFWFAKGNIAEDLGDTILAMKSYNEALLIYPSADAMLALANLYAEQKNESSLLICAQVKRLSLGREYDAHAAFISGVYNARTGNKTKALAFFDECIANDYTYMEAYIEKGLVYFDNKAYRLALNVFTFATTVNALDSDPYYWQGRCYEMMLIKDSAVLRYKQALNFEKDSKEIMDALKRTE